MARMLGYCCDPTTVLSAKIDSPTINVPEPEESTAPVLLAVLSLLVKTLLWMVTSALVAKIATPSTVELMVNNRAARH